MSEEVDHFDGVPEGLTAEDRHLDPFSWYSTMRDTQPVRYDERRGAWDVFRYETVNRVLSDHEQFSSRQPTGSAPDQDPEVTQRNQTMLHVDPPEHERLWGVVQEYFSSSHLQTLRPALEQRTTEYLDAALADGNDMAFVEAVAVPIPIITIAELLGVPAADRERFKAWSTAQTSAPADQTDAAIEANRQQRLTATREQREYIKDFIARRKQQPQDDLLSKIVYADEELTDNEIIGFCMLFLNAGHFTMTNLLTNAVWTIAEEDLVSDIHAGTISLQRAVEEVLRYRSSLQSMPRWTQTAVELHGTTIPADELVVAWIGSANRDERQFDAPNTFRPERRPNPHLAFGQGIHHCLGAPLARLEAMVVLTAFFERIQDIEIATETFAPNTQPNEYGLSRLPLTVTT